MARNEEKAQGLLNRWTKMKSDFADGGEQERRPFLAAHCDTLSAAEKWRRQILREVTKSIASIQNAGLGEGRIRELNDEINKLLREKGHWQRRIKELGGPDYGRAPRQAGSEAEGQGVGGKGYLYFGAAKNLPGVRELFAAQEKQASSAAGKKRTRGDMYKGIDPDYYGFRDEDDGVLVAAEAAAEAEAVAASLARHRATKRCRASAEAEGGVSVGGGSEDGSDNDEGGGGGSGSAPSAYVAVPSQADIEKLIMARKKETLLAKYASADIQARDSEAKAILNVQTD
jgi:pre-mRNA-splicing factor ISY1